MKPFTCDEIKCAVFDMGPAKAPGPDGFHAVFFQKFWDIVRTKVSHTCLKVLNREESIKKFNDTNVVLILKIKSLGSLKNFRPVSLCSVVYKIITKTLANRLKLVLQDIIDPCQSAFVPGRLIFDNVLTSYELLHSITQRKSGKIGWAAIKLDLSKAYDRVEWRFLETVMKKLGFSVECGEWGSHRWGRRSVASAPFLLSSYYPNLRKEVMVADFIDKQRHCWYMRKLQEFFLNIDIELILSIPVSTRDRDDFLMWHFDKKGIYSVKSGYKLAVEAKGEDLGLSSIQKGE
ncbi:hypothetical protein Dsin_005058 [Dipteronia sinensis]|uniref:Reverse transcriptase domain-containing protein n=1 Tax=Dipteronia sinensis TaxID=43782 RepID=A0AAE0AVT4_9ROSI|nr:hypothetical protein Dsin_005058 [Dipteronia sinensis]